MLSCPRCTLALSQKRNSLGIYWYCEPCDGSVVTMSLLRKFVPRGALNDLWQSARRGDKASKCRCSGCRNQMQAVAVKTVSGRERELDVCTHCQSIWLDSGEWQDLAHLKIPDRTPPALGNVKAKVREHIVNARLARQTPPPLQTPPRVPVMSIEQVAVRADSAPRQSVRASKARAQSGPERNRRPDSNRRHSSSTVAERSSTDRPIGSHRHQSNVAREALNRQSRTHRRRVRSEPDRTREWGEGPREFWHWIPGILGMPVENVQPKEHRRNGEKPWLTWTLAVGIFLVSVLAMFDLQVMVDRYGLVPSEFGRMGGLTWLTSFFLHGGLLHLLGNLYFLVVFGDNVEKCFGSLELLCLIVAAAVFGDFVHILMDPHSTIPCVGASGGISGVIAFYALRFPKTQLSMMFWFFFKPVWFHLRAIWMFFLWILLQVVLSGQQIAGLSDISGGAHLGGAFIGFVAWLLWRLGGGERDCREAISTYK